MLFDGVREVGRRMTLGTALLHLGGVGFPLTGPLRYTMTAAEAGEVCRLLRPRTVVPVHYEGWGHFREGRAVAERTPAGAPAQVRDAFRRLPPGTAAELSV